MEHTDTKKTHTLTNRYQKAPCYLVTILGLFMVTGEQRKERKRMVESVLSHVAIAFENCFSQLYPLLQFIYNAARLTLCCCV